MKLRPHRRSVLAVLLAAALGTACSPREQPVAFEALDISGADWGRDFALRDSEGHPRTLADYRGKAVLVFFGFTQCPDICPTALSRAAEVMQHLGPEAARLQVIFVTIDPERDTPALLREYTRAFHPSFVGLHGDEATTAATAAQFKVFYRKVPTGSSYTMDHSAISYVFDPQGRLRLAVKHEQPAASLAADIGQLLKEPRS
ncbi:MAG: SCO family protein [Burkholderiales bacterium]|nr:SCO family protein [Burkholderiales bacterium]